MLLIELNLSIFELIIELEQYVIIHFEIISDKFVIMPQD